MSTHDDDIEVVEHNNERSYTIPMVSQNAPHGYTLDLFKQYKRQVEYCDREIMRIHDKNINKKT